MKSPENLAVSLLPQPPLVFTAISYGTLSSQHWKPGLCSLVWGRDPSLPRYPSQFLSTTRECGASRSTTATTLCATWCLLTSPPVFVSPPPHTQLDECGFFNSLVVGFPYSLIFWQFSVLFWGLIVILSVVARESEAVYLHLHLDQKSVFVSLLWLYKL